MNISEEHRSYIIGFIHGDGSYYTQSRNRGRILIELSKRDKDILDKIENVLIDVGRSARTRDTNFKKNYESCTLNIYKKEIRDFLNIPVGKKADMIAPPKDISIKHYIRGLYDADGSIGITSKNRPFWSLCTSSEDVKVAVIKDIEINTGLVKRLNRNKRDNNYNIVIFDEDAIAYTDYLYSGATIFLDRKYSKFLEFSNWERTITKRLGRRKSWTEYEDEVVLSGIKLEDKMLLLNRSKSSVKNRMWRLRQGNKIRITS